MPERQQPPRDVVQRPVVVGVDGSLPSRRAVLHAAREAARRDCRLRIVHATMWGESPADRDVVLAEAADLAGECLPADAVTVVAAIGRPADVLIEEGERAQLLVAGNRGAGGFVGLFLGSVGVEVAALSRCPVLIVRQSDGEEAGSDGPVVVGVGGGHEGPEVLDAAFRAAHLAHAPVFAVHAWHHPVLVGAAQAPALAYQSVYRPLDEAALIAAAVEPYAALFPDVQVETRIRQGHAGHVLVEASAGARLLVVGTRGRGEVTGLLLGSAGQAAIHHAECPVLVVPAGRRGETNRGCG